MKKVILLAVLVVALTLVGCNNGAGKEVPKGQLKPAKRNPVIVIVDLQRVSMESEAGKTRHDAIQEWAKEKDQEFRQRLAEYRAAEAMGKTPKNQVEAMKTALGRMQQEMQQEYQKRSLRSGEEMEKVFDTLIDKLAKQNGWDLVINKVDQVALWTNDAMDQTDYVIAELNKTTSQPVPPENTDKDKKEAQNKEEVK